MTIPTRTQVDRSAFAVTITATTHIAASAERVWAVLTDTDSYPEWNPFVRRLDGDLTVGSKLSVDLQPNEKKPTTMRPKVVAVEPGKSFTWLGHVGIPGVLDGRHTFTVTAQSDGGCVLVQHEKLSGMLTPLFRSMLETDTPAAFVASNDALAARALA